MQQQWMLSLLSLFLLLLVFFILLTSNTQQDNTRLRATMENIKSAFENSYRLGGSASAPSGVQRPPNFEEVVSRYFNDVGSLVQGAVELLYMNKTPDGRMMRMVLPYRAVFEPVSGNVRPSLDSFWYSLAAALERTIPGGEVRLDIALVVPGFFEETIPSESDVLTERINAVGKKLMESGLRESQLQTGVILHQELQKVISTPNLSPQDRALFLNFVVTEKNDLQTPVEK